MEELKQNYGKAIDQSIKVGWVDSMCVWIWCFKKYKVTLNWIWIDFKPLDLMTSLQEMHKVEEKFNSKRMQSTQIRVWKILEDKWLDYSLYKQIEGCGVMLID